MFHPTMRRTLQAAGALISIGALALTCASTASAAIIPTTSSAQSANITLLGQTSGTQTITAYQKNGVADTEDTSSKDQLSESILSVGAFAATAVAQQRKAYSCAGIISPGGKLSVGGDAEHCSITGAGARGVQLDLGQLTNALPLGIGSVVLKFNGITAAAQYNNGALSGLGKLTNLRLYVCDGLALLGACQGKDVVLTPVLTGAPNEDVLGAVITSLTQSKQLGVLGTLLANALKPVVSLTSNVQTQTATSITVTGLQVKLLGGMLGSVNLATASAGRG